MTVVAGPGSLEHGARSAPEYNEADSDLDAEGEDDIEMESGETPPAKENLRGLDSEEPDSEAEIDAENDDDDEGGELSAESTKPKVSRVGVKQGEDAEIEEEEDEEDEEAEASTVTEEEGASDDTDSDADSDEVGEYDGTSEAAETAASAEVQARNNCV